MLVFADAGNTIHELSNVIGRGGEGVVYALRGNPDVVAKIYHDQLAASRADKVKAMARVTSTILPQFAAWPSAVLYTKGSRRFAGFTMQRLGASQPVHQLYGPKSRLQTFPKASYRFLIHVATNICRAFAVAHSLGIVVGDVNQNTVMVAQDGTIKLIDCDSFQLREQNATYRCEVGVPLFTPPELQGCDFKKVERTENHDAFGLAVLIFQLLFMGKHPFAGRYSGAGDLPIEKAIALRQFPYAISRPNPQFQPPPNALELRLVGKCAELFERSFCAVERPRAEEWIYALTSLAKSLKSCVKNPAHQFPAMASECPWCRIEMGTGVFLFAAVIAISSERTVDFGLLWKRIKAIAPPQVPARLAPPPLPALPPSHDALRYGKARRKRFLIAGICCIALFFFPLAGAPMWLVVVGCLLSFVLAAKRQGGEDTFRKARSTEFQSAISDLAQCEREWNQLVSENRFVKKLSEFEKLKEAGSRLPKERAAKLQELESNKRAIQLRAYLDRFFIKDGSIPGIGPGRAAKLAAFGIETAADVTPFIHVDGFGPVYKKRLCDWKSSLERRFRFDPSKAIDPSEINKVNAEYSKTMQTIVGQLDAAPAMLTLLAKELDERMKNVDERYRRAWQKKIQAGIDLGQIKP